MTKKVVWGGEGARLSRLVPFLITFLHAASSIFIKVISNNVFLFPFFHSLQISLASIPIPVSKSPRSCHKTCRAYRNVRLMARDLSVCLLSPLFASLCFLQWRTVDFHTVAGGNGSFPSTYPTPHLSSLKLCLVGFCHSVECCVITFCSNSRVSSTFVSPHVLPSVRHLGPPVSDV